MANYADSNRVSVRRVRESAWASTPAGPNMQDFNLTSESFQSNVETVTSETIRADRMVSDITPVGGGASGDIGFELRYGDIDDLIEAALQGTWVSVVASAAASCYFSGSKVRAGNSSALNALVSGNFVRITNASTTGNNGTYRVANVSITGASATVDLTVASTGAAASFNSEVFNSDTLLQGNNVRNGTTSRSYTIEKEFADVSSFARYTGMRVTSMGLSFESQAIMTGTFGFAGSGQTTASATLASAVTSANTNTVMNASDNVSNIWEGGQAITGIAFQSVSLNLNNNPRDQAKVGSASLAGVATGRGEITGDLTAYLENNALMDKFTANTKSNLRFQIDDTNGNSYIVDLPRITYTGFTNVATGGNSDVVQEGSFGASVDPTGTYQIQITALDA